MVADMETECYPCIPMHSASNQKRMNHSTITMIKTEPLSEDVNVVVDDQENSNDLKSAGSSSLSHSLSRQQNLQKQAANTRKRSVQNQNQQLQQTQQNTTTTTTAPSRVQQHTIRLSRVSQDILLFMHTCKLGEVRLSKLLQLHLEFSSIPSRVSRFLSARKLCLSHFYWSPFFVLSIV